MKAFFDQIEHLFGIRLEAYFPYIVAAIVVYGYFNMKHQITALQNEIAVVEGAQNMTSSLSKSDLTPIVQSVNLANEKLVKIQDQTSSLMDRLPDLENGISLANQKLTYLENQKTGAPGPGSPAAAENKPTPVH